MITYWVGLYYTSHVLTLLLSVSVYFQVMVSLGHLLDVISKNTLEMLPGNGTIVLDTVCNVHSLVTSHDLNCQRYVLFHRLVVD